MIAGAEMATSKEDLLELIELAKAGGLEGSDLAAFLRDERQRQHEERRFALEEAAKQREHDEAAKQRDEAAKQRDHEMAIAQMQQKQVITGENAGDTSINSGNGGHGGRAPKLPFFDDKQDDMDAYLHRFEKYATAQGWPKDSWVTSLSALLKGVALDVYYRMPVDKLGDYEALRDALLKRFQMTEAGFKDRFRQAKPETGESFSQFIARLENYFERWVELAKAEKTYTGVKTLMIGDQALWACSKELRLYVSENKPKDLEEMGKLAERYLDVHSMAYSYGRVRPVSGHQRQGLTRGKPQSPKTPQDGTKEKITHGAQGSDTRYCYACGKPGHIAKFCRAMGKGSSSRQQSTALQCEDSGPETLTLQSGDSVPVQFQGEQAYLETKGGVRYKLSPMALAVDQPNKMPVVYGFVKGHQDPVKVLRDTGCSGAVIHARLCSEGEYTGTYKSAVMIDGSIIQAPVVQKSVDTPYFVGQVKAMAMKAPVYDLVIGNLEGARPAENPDEAWKPVQQASEDVEHAGAVMTRSQKAAKPPRPLKVAGTKVMDVRPEELKKLQEADPTLSQVREWLAEGRGDNPRSGCTERFYKKGGVIMRDYTSPRGNGSDVTTQLVLPRELRDGVMEVAHDSILGGHLGAQKTKDRIISNFYWPGVQADVTRYCQSCDICQRTVAKGKTPKAPLGNVPIIDTPFTRVAVDLIGPLPKSANGYRYALTLVDYATRYPEAVPLKRIDVCEVAEALVSIFSRVGIPREILSDRGTQFTSEIMGEVARLLSMKQLFTTPYHAMCNGLVERFNGTLKTMLKRMCAERPSDWDRYIDALLFAYREVPQESLKFSPFELVYGRTVRGPLAVMRELWTGEMDGDDEKTTFQYVLELRERLEETCQLAHEELRKARVSQRKYYNRKARKRDFKVDDQVLVLLPTDNNKLLMQWKGPFNVVECKGDNGLVLDVAGHRKTFHYNMVRKYVQREPVTPQSVVCCGSLYMEHAYSAVADDDEMFDHDEVLPCPLERKETWKDVQVGGDLTDKQRREAADLLKAFDDVLTDLPGRTDLEECSFELTTAEPFRAKCYPMPYALQQEMNAEVEKMLEMGIIEPSVSEYASPSLVVTKPDGTYRYIVDLRKLNSITLFDAEPLPNQEVVINKIGKKRYLSKMDLSKGYWQVPLKKEDRRLTAFPTDQGLMQFKYMPFGCVNSGAIFCRMVRKLLRGLDSVASYVDDLIIFSDEWQDHLRVIRQVLERLRRHGLTARPSKCEVGCSRVKLLGHVVGDGELQPQEEKVRKIDEVPRPQDKKQLRSFLGLVGYYRKFLQGYADKAKLLTDMTRKNEPNQLRWTDEADAAYRDLKKAIAEYPILRLPQFDRPFILSTDASGVGLGAVLMQEFQDGRMPVLYISRKLKPAETRYSVIERECLGLVWAVKKLHQYLFGREFILETDHQPLLFLDRTKISNDRVMRWALTMQQYRYRVRVVRGIDNVAADYLSRCV